MKILHITPSSGGYEEVTLIANRVSKNNPFSLVERKGIEYMSGGFLINDTKRIRAVLDLIHPDEQYEFVKEFKMNPFVKAYAEDEVMREELDCPYDFRSRCTLGRCDCEPKQK
jgi:hypothetical protein